MTEIKLVTEITPNIRAAFSKLIPQLAPDSKIPSLFDLEKIISTQNTYLFIAQNTQIVGTLTVVVNQIPTGAKAWIEDVVVDENAQKQNIGEKLVRFAIDHAFGLGVTNINLTSTPSRIAANGLYKKMGFEQRETNVYRMIIKEKRKAL